MCPSCWVSSLAPVTVAAAAHHNTRLPACVWPCRAAIPLRWTTLAAFRLQDQVKGYTDYPFLDEKLAKELQEKLSTSSAAA